MKLALKTLLEDLLSTLVFLGVFALTGSAPITTAIAAGVGLVQIGWEKTHGRPVAPLQYLSIALVLIFGGASYYTNDPRIIMYKPSLIYCAVAIAMMQKGWLDRYVPARVHDNVPRFVIVASGYAWAAMMLAVAAGNLVVAADYDRTTWALYNTVVPLAAKFAGFGLQYLLFRTIVRSRLRRPALENA